MMKRNAVLVTIWLSAIAFVTVLPAHAQDAREKAAATKNKEKKEQEAKKLGDLDLCKEQARGLKGPERSRFFTKCLRGNL